jgi:hypothetical protein
MATTQHTVEDDDGAALWRAAGVLPERTWWQSEDAFLNRQHERMTDDRDEMQRYAAEIARNRAIRLGLPLDASVEADRRARLGHYADEFDAQFRESTRQDAPGAPQTPVAARNDPSTPLRAVVKAVSAFQAKHGLPPSNPNRRSQSPEGRHERYIRQVAARDGLTLEQAAAAHPPHIRKRR